MKSYKEFREEIQEVIDNRNPHLRKGQAVFNYIYTQYNIGVRTCSTNCPEFYDETALIDKKYDPFYKDENIEAYVKVVYDTLRDLD